MVVGEKPGSPAEVLEQSGVKGMKWGVRRESKAGGRAVGVATTKAASKAGVGRVEAKRAGRAAGGAAAKSAYKEGKAARPAQKGIALTRSSREFRAQHPTGKLQAKAIYNARKESRIREKAIRKEKDSVERARLKRDHMNHPGTAVALRSTRGEKFVDIFIASHVTDKGLVGDISAISTGSTIGKASERRRIERRQRKGGFK